MKKVQMLFVFIMLLLIPGFVYADDSRWCTDGYLYDFKDVGSNVKVSSVTGADILRSSVLPDDYFDMKNSLDDGISRGSLTFEKIDSYLNGGVEFDSSVREFVDKYRDTYNRYVDIYKQKKEADYAFSAVSLGQKCNTAVDKDGNQAFLSCPNDNTVKKYNIDKIKESVSVKFNENTHLFDVVINDKFDENVVIRVANVSNKNDNSYSLSYLNKMNMLYGSTLYYLTSNRIVTLSYGASYNVIIEFYLKEDLDDECAGAYLGTSDFTTPSYAFVKSPMVNSQLCKNFRNNKNLDGSVNSDYEKIPTTPTNYKKYFVPECYSDSEYDYFSDEYSNINSESVQKNIDRVALLFKNSSSINVGGTINKQCKYYSDNRPQEEVLQEVTYVYGKGTYWAASCTERVIVSYDGPKKLKAGTGFDYNTTVRVERTCEPFIIKQASAVEKCKYKIECWYGPHNYKGGAGAGPSEDFDDCVSSCDGGKYTKNCVNQCYSKVYENKEDVYLSFLDVVKDKSSSSVIKTANTDKDPNDCSEKHAKSSNACYYKKGNKSWWYRGIVANSISDYNKENKNVTDKGTPIYQLAAKSSTDDGCNGFQCKTIHGLLFNYLGGCDSTVNPTICYEVYASKPRPYCSDNPDVDGTADDDTINEIKSEYKKLVKKLESYEKIEDFSISIVDSYLTDDDKLKTTKFTDLVTLSSSTTKNKTEGSSVKYIKNSDDTIKTDVVTVTKEYKVSLPKAYINKLTADVRYAKNDSKIGEDEIDGNNKYYTQLKSLTYNDFRSWSDQYSPEKTNVNPDIRSGNNIHVSVSNVGTEQAKGEYTWKEIDIDCFYGLINEYIKIDCSEEEICDTGLQYSFRQVNLSDLFPDREARYNWRQTVNVGNSYTSNAKLITKDIEEEGNSCYSHEAEYEFVISKSDIDKIRKYNKGKSYQDYPDMNCDVIYGSGIKTCKSSFIGQYTTDFKRNTILGQNTTRND